MTHNVLVDKSIQGTRVRTARTAALGENLLLEGDTWSVP